ncbi:MAG TPA: four-helix bundle copper-binding protein [Kofleriaceae bacterium]|jgi:hypothetical protein
MEHLIERMAKAHPAPESEFGPELGDCYRVTLECSQVCSACADACLAEHHVDPLIHCIRLCLDAADICGTTARVLSRQTAPDLGIITMMLEVCARTAHACADECERHAVDHVHCQICAIACFACIDACRKLLDAGRPELHH